MPNVIDFEKEQRWVIKTELTDVAEILERLEDFSR